MATHTVTSGKLKEYLQNVEIGKIQIPEFQRPFVWGKSDMIKLASSLLKGYPIGSFLLMQNTQGYASRQVEGSENRNNPLSDCVLVLDGQQRTTSAFQILYGKGDYKFYFCYKQFIKLYSEFNERFNEFINNNHLKDNDIEKEKDKQIDSLIEDNLEELIEIFENNKAPQNFAEEIAKGYFPLNIILSDHTENNYSKWLDDYTWNYSINEPREVYNSLSSVKAIFLNKLLNNIISYPTSEILIDGNTSPNIVCTIFETVNSTGKTLTILDLLNAKCFPKSFFLSQEIDKIIEENQLFQDFNIIKNSLIGISLIKIIGLKSERKSCKKSDLLSLNANEIIDNWDLSVEILNNGLEYFKNQFGVIGNSYLPYKDMIPPISVIVHDNRFNLNSVTHIKKLNKWYWYSVFTGYFDNATESKSSQVLKEFFGVKDTLGWLEDDNQIPVVIRNNSNLINSDFSELNDSASTQSAIYKAILNIITLNEAEDFSSDRKLLKDLKENDLQDHHIFPKKFLSLQTPVIKGKEANTILNRTLITADSNQKIKDKQPSTYFNDVDIFGENLFEESNLSKHFIDIEFTNTIYTRGVFTIENFNDFKKFRKNSIVNFIKEKIK